MKCPYCSTNHTVKNGVRYDGLQKYKCCDCGKQFTKRTGSLFAGMRFSERIITSALMLKFRGRNSLREIRDIIGYLLDIKVSHVSPYNWNLKFSSQLEIIQNKFKLKFTKVWHVDEMFIRVRGSKSKKNCSYLYVVEDSEGKIVAMHVSHKRDVRSVKEVLKEALKNAGFEPEIIVTDQFRSYYVAIKKLLLKATHVRAHFKAKVVKHKHLLLRLSNNKIERLNGTIRTWLYSMRGFKSLVTANLWITMYAVYYNYLMPHIPYREKTIAAATRICELEWRNLSAVAVATA
jgi:transposase-like protein